MPVVMDTGTLMAERTAATGRMAGELLWWIDPDGRLYAGERARALPGSWAAGRVCPESRIGVIESIGGRAAVLGLLPRSLVDVLAVRFPGVRWAVADVVPSVLPAAALRE